MLITIEGLDFTGKTTIAQEVSRLTKLPYLKVKKGSILNYNNCKNETEVVTRILEEYSLARQEQSCIMDRGYLSAIITGKIYDPKINITKLMKTVPDNIKPDIGIITITNLETAIERMQGRYITEQDKKVVNESYEQNQEEMRKITNNQYHLINNNYKTKKELYKTIENIIEKIGVEIK